MRAHLPVCLSVTLFSCFLCIAGASTAATAPSSQASPSAQTKTTLVGMLCPTENEAARQQYNTALNLRQQGRLQEAEAAYRKAIELDPRFCDAMDNLGQMLRSTGATDQAIFWYQRSLTVRPDNGAAHQNLAVAYKIQGDLNRAVAEFQWLIQHEPKNPEGYYGLGDLYLSAGQTEAAIAPLLHAEKLYQASGSPLLADAQYELAVAFYLQKSFLQAQEYLTRIYAERENDPNVNYLLGLCYLEPPLGNLQKAREYLFKAKKLGGSIPQEVLQRLGN